MKPTSTWRRGKVFCILVTPFQSFHLQLFSTIPCTVRIVLPVRSQENAQWIWSGLLTKIRVVGCVGGLVTVRHTLSHNRAATAALLFLSPSFLRITGAARSEIQPVPTTLILHYHAYAFVSTINCFETNFVSPCSFVNTMSSKVYYSNNKYGVPYAHCSMKTEKVNKSFWVEIRPLCRCSKT
jgi:hypothetical protein